MASVTNTITTTTTNDDDGDDDRELSTRDRTIQRLRVTVPGEVRTKPEATRVRHLMVGKAKRDMISERRRGAGVVADNVDNASPCVCRSCAVALAVPSLEDTRDHSFTHERTLTRTPSVNLTMILGCGRKVCGAHK